MSVIPRTPEPISEFVRELITEWEQSGKTLKDLAKKAGLGTSMPSQIKAKTSDVTNYSGPKFARVWGWTYPELVSRAYEWWAAKQRGESVPAAAISGTPEQDRAVAMAKTMGASDADIGRILTLYSGREMSELEWLRAILFFAAPQDSEAPPAQKRAQKNEERATNRRAKKKQDEIRAAAEKLKEPAPKSARKAGAA